MGSDQQAALDRAKQQLRQASRSLEEAEQLARDRLARGSRPRPESNLSTDRLPAIQFHIKQQRARVARNQALCYPAGSTDRLAALAEGVRLLDSALTSRSVEDPGGNELLLEHAILKRLSGDLRASQRSLNAMRVDEVPQMVLRQRAERVRLYLASQEWDRVHATIGEGRVTQGQSSADLDFAMLEAHVAEWRRAADEGDDERAESWRERAIAAAKFIELHHGTYWARRADIALVDAGRGTGAGSVAILAKTADDLFLKQQFDEASRVYARASVAADQAGDAELAFELAFKVALIMQQRLQHEAAADQFRRVALKWPDDERADQAHLSAILHTAELVRGQQATLDVYEALLAEHLDMWRHAATAVQVALWQGQLHAQREQWMRAIESYQVVFDNARRRPQPANARLHLGQAVEAMADAWSRELRQYSEAREVRQAVSRAIHSFDEFGFRQSECSPIARGMGSC